MGRMALNKRLTQGALFLDGAMGTQLIAAGAPTGGCGDELNVTHPKIVQSVHQRYLDAGCEAILTNSFGANPISLARHGLQDKTEQINRAAAAIARQAAGDGRYVLGDIGPCGEFLEPLGTLSETALREAFCRQAAALADGGVDGFIIETMAALEEVEVAVQAIQKVAAGLPVFVSMAFDPAGESARTMMGVSPAQMVARLAGAGVSAVGFNCGTLDMAGYARLAEAFVAAAKPAGLLVLAEPNAGKPDLVDGKAVYTLPPAEFAAALADIATIGARILGGCCGTTPAHLAAAISQVGRIQSR